MTVEKRVFVTKWVGKARNREILIPIDAARSGDIENRGFGKKLQDNHRKMNVFLFGAGGPTGPTGKRRQPGTVRPTGDGC